MSVAYNVFVIWSGSRSKAMGEAFRDWLPHVIQSAVPFFSDKDIASGALWHGSLQASLQSVRFAVVCCTTENVTAPWLNYEAGALVERMNGRTAPWLLDGKPEELQPSPISRLQAKAANPVGTLAVLQALNDALTAPVPASILEAAFQTHWAKLEAKLRAIPAGESKPKEREPADMLQEVVGLTRQISSDLARFSGKSTHGMVEEAAYAVGFVGLYREMMIQEALKEILDRIPQKLSMFATRRILSEAQRQVEAIKSAQGLLTFQLVRTIVSTVVEDAIAVIEASGEESLTIGLVRPDGTTGSFFRPKT